VKIRLDASEDETIDYSKWFNDSAAWLNDLLTRAVIIWSTSITAINSIELYNLSAVIGGVMIRVGISKRSVVCAFSLSRSLLYFALHHSLSFIRPSPLFLHGTTTGFRRGYQPH